MFGDAVAVAGGTVAGGAVDGVFQLAAREEGGVDLELGREALGEGAVGVDAAVEMIVGGEELALGGERGATEGDHAGGRGTVGALVGEEGRLGLGLVFFLPIHVGENLQRRTVGLGAAESHDGDAGDDDEEENEVGVAHGLRPPVRRFPWPRPR